LLYSLAIDAEIKSLRSLEQKLFTADFFKKNIISTSNIKRTFKEMSLVLRSFSDIFSEKEKSNDIHLLSSALKKKNKIAFVNILLKNFLQKGKQYRESINHLVKYIFQNIVNNNTNWENYALIAIIGLIAGGSDDNENMD
jgi:DNA mismatch repair ATPase MutS